MKMRHSITGGIADTDQAGFDEVWKDLGWELVEEENGTGYAEGASPAELSAQAEADRLAALSEVETGTTPDDQAADKPINPKK